MYIDAKQIRSFSIFFNVFSISLVFWVWCHENERTGDDVILAGIVAV